MYRIAVGEGSPEGTNSAYVFPDQGVVIDPGPPSDIAWQNLRNGLQDIGLQLNDLQTILVSHWHIDHVGLAPRLADLTDATIFMHKADVPLAAEYKVERKRRIKRDTRHLKRWGVPEDVTQSVQDHDTPSPFPDLVPVQALSNGDQVAGFELVHTPGHTRGHAAFATNEQIFVGDAILPTYTPNIGGSDTRTKRPLETYRQTLNRLQTREETAYPGHGTEVSLENRINEIIAHHEERSEHVLTVVRRDQPVTPWDVARVLFGEMSGIHVKMGAGEAAAHLTALSEGGCLRRIDDNPLTFTSKS
ncbi:MBL fold metallo-hydrolase [Haladaptatus salinisoli]|uniref:MBL fold metallo-hydrolase n=1 Tax=Haladaptatus salinisoli TaxID=2884876 RepID=UPI001D0BB7E3|nr:MBL fold metallo-hydrolase [Haladaptatus salinisoli]